MALLMVSGYLAVAEGRRVSSVKPNSTTKTYHCLYTTALQSTGGVCFPGELRIYSPFNDVILPDDTVGFVMAKAYFPANAPEEKILLEASHFFAVPGNPSSDTYESSIPDCLVPFVFGLGTVPACPPTLPDGVSRAFSVVVSDYVRDGRKSSTVQCVLEGARARWKRTPSPAVNSCVHFFGLLSGVAANGGVSVSLESIVLNVGIPDPAVTQATQPKGKKRKLSAFVNNNGPSDTTALVSTASSTFAGGVVGESSPVHSPLAEEVSEGIPCVSPGVLPVEGVVDAVVRGKVMDKDT